MLTPPRQLIVPLSFNRYVYFSSLILRDLYFWLFKHRCLFVYTQLQFCTWYLNQPCCLCITSITTWYRLNLILCLLSVFYNLINKCIWFFYLGKNLQQTSYTEDQGFLTMIWIQRPGCYSMLNVSFTRRPHVLWSLCKECEEAHLSDLYAGS